MPIRLKEKKSNPAWECYKAIHKTPSRTDNLLNSTKTHNKRGINRLNILLLLLARACNNLFSAVVVNMIRAHCFIIWAVAAIYYTNKIPIPVLTCLGPKIFIWKMFGTKQEADVSSRIKKCQNLKTDGP